MLNNKNYLALMYTLSGFNVYADQLHTYIYIYIHTYIHTCVCVWTPPMFIHRV